MLVHAKQMRLMAHPNKAGLVTSGHITCSQSTGLVPNLHQVPKGPATVPFRHAHGPRKCPVSEKADISPWGGYDRNAEADISTERWIGAAW
jgi:hypothetical protein